MAGDKERQASHTKTSPSRRNRRRWVLPVLIGTLAVVVFLVLYAFKDRWLQNDVEVDLKEPSITTLTSIPPSPTPTEPRPSELIMLPSTEPTTAEPTLTPTSTPTPAPTSTPSPTPTPAPVYATLQTKAPPVNRAYAGEVELKLGGVTLANAEVYLDHGQIQLHMGKIDDAKLLSLDYGAEDFVERWMASSIFGEEGAGPEEAEEAIRQSRAIFHRLAAVEEAADTPENPRATLEAEVTAANAKLYASLETKREGTAPLFLDGRKVWAEVMVWEGAHEAIGEWVETVEAALSAYMANEVGSVVVGEQRGSNDDAITELRATYEATMAATQRLLDKPSERVMGRIYVVNDQMVRWEAEFDHGPRDNPMMAWNATGEGDPSDAFSWMVPITDPKLREGALYRLSDTALPGDSLHRWSLEALDQVLTFTLAAEPPMEGTEPFLASLYNEKDDSTIHLTGEWLYQLQTQIIELQLDDTKKDGESLPFLSELSLYADLEPEGVRDVPAADEAIDLLSLSTDELIQILKDVYPMLRLILKPFGY